MVQRTSGNQESHKDTSYTFSARRAASLDCCSAVSALSTALSFSSFIACIFFLMASILAAFGGVAASEH